MCEQIGESCCLALRCMNISWEIVSRLLSHCLFCVLPHVQLSYGQDVAQDCHYGLAQSDGYHGPPAFPFGTETEASIPTMKLRYMSGWTRLL